MLRRVLVISVTCYVESFLLRAVKCPPLPSDPAWAGPLRYRVFRCRRTTQDLIRIRIKRNIIQDLIRIKAPQLPKI